MGRKAMQAVRASSSLQGAHGTAALFALTPHILVLCGVASSEVRRLALGKPVQARAPTSDEEGKGVPANSH